MEVRDNPESRFIKVGKRPARFFLKARQKELTASLAAKLEQPNQPAPEALSVGYKERDLHPLLTYFASASPAFNRGREIITKTIHHEKSKKSGFSDWTHPDIVGFSVPLDDWHSDVIALNDLSDRNALTLFSFELKRHLSKGTYREAYFQSVSNSSWAHQGYLVAAEIDEDDDLLAELGRLTAAFGIGIIHLRLKDFGASEVRFPARTRGVLDWETINKLCEQNVDFRRFVQSVKIDVNAKKIHRAEYDPVIGDVSAHMERLAKSHPS